ncbi:SAM-dependent methyltransferase [Beijerinckia sp. GAS462]|nr:SAM-dependent methyltransferase [Beijerinckia sp. GAS462]SEC63581.1 pimeloyl-CoA biosynthesis protein BioC [Beijerinckia sp. 28-YEA-48]
MTNLRLGNHNGTNMVQNIYDQSDFFEGYSHLARSTGGLEAAPEWPILRAMLPPVKGLRIVDLGCGYGWFCRWAQAQGAAHVLGLDLSEKMLARAREMSSGAAIVYERADLEQLALPSEAFDLAYSSLALHYLEDARRLFATVHQALVPGGRFVFSTEHPIFMAPTRQGWAKDAEGRRIWPLDRYSVEGPRTTDWLAKGVLKYHRTVATTLNLLIGAGFSIARVEEFAPTAEQIEAQPDLQEELDRPMFLLVSAKRQGLGEAAPVFPVTAGS